MLSAMSFNELFIYGGNEHSTARDNVPRKHRVVASLCPTNNRFDGSHCGPKAKCDNHWARENIHASSSAMGVGAQRQNAEEDVVQLSNSCKLAYTAGEEGRM
jgi:hypothetical protein